MTDKLRKYVLPNIPYVFIGWVFLKLGTAYRLAAGSDFAHKLLGLGQTIGAAFADFAPGLALFDWLVGIVGAVAFRLLLLCKATVLNLVLASGASFVSSFFYTFFFSCFLFFFFRSSRVILSRFSCVGRI